MTKYFDAERQRMVFVKAAATADFWDDHWLKEDVATRIARESKSTFHTAVTRRFLPARPETRLLDGGCGVGGIVASLRRGGFDAWGVDTAAQTIATARAAAPDLPLQVGDVTALPFPDASFDGYWSLGVIEHTYHGYRPIIEEAYRVLRPGGFLFLTFPYFNLLRRSKARLGLYPAWDGDAVDVRRRFYQFALPWEETKDEISQLGFQLRLHHAVDGFKGFKDEVTWLKRPLQYLYGLSSRPVTIVRNGVSVMTAPLAGHVMLAVFQKA